MKRLIHTSLFIFLGMVLALPAAAYGVAVKPAQIEQKVDPGTVKTFTMTVTNLEDKTLILYPIVRNVTGVDDNSHPIFEPSGDGVPHDVAAWLNFKKDQISVPPKGSASVDVTANFPTDATPGSHLAGFFFSDKPITDLQILGASVGFDVGAILHFQIAGEAITKASIRHLSTDHSIYGKPPVDFSVAVENMGNTLVRPVGFIDITNMMGKKVASIPINDTGAGVFPKTTREWKAAWAPSEIVIGKFTAMVALAIDTEQGTDTLTRQVEFWILPINIILPTIIGFTIFLLVSYVLLRLYVRNQLRSVQSNSQKGKTKAAEGFSIFTSVIIGLLLAIIIGFLVLFFYFG